MNKTHALFAWLLLPALALWASAIHAEDNDTQNDDTGVIKITAPIEAIDTSVTPNTITLLGRVIAVPPAALVAGDGDNDGDEDANGEDNGKGDDADNPPDDENGEEDADDAVSSVSQLSVGEFVTVHLASDTAPLTTTELRTEGAYEGRLIVQGPIQAVGTGAKVITVLNRDIDISTAMFVPDADDNDDAPVFSLTNFLVGQNVKVTLDPARLPTEVALKVELHKFDDQVELVLQNNAGVQIPDDGQDVHVNLLEIARTASANAFRRFPKPVTMSATTRTGDVTFTGLPSGRARIAVTRHGRTFRRVITIAPNENSRMLVTMRVGR